jgi:hypothetical protein
MWIKAWVIKVKNIVSRIYRHNNQLKNITNNLEKITNRYQTIKKHNKLVN